MNLIDAYESSKETFEKRREIRKEVLNSPMAITGYIWDIIRNLITLFIVFSIYSNIYDSDTKLLFSGILIIYLSMVAFNGISGLANAQSILFNAKMHLRTQKLILQSQGQKDNYQIEEDDILRTEITMEKTQYKFYINLVFNFILYVVAILNLIS